MELSFIFYLFTAFILIPATFFWLSVFNKPIAGGIATIGMFTLFILFGLQIYNLDGSYATQVNVAAWPPSINQCPDFLTLFKMPAMGSEKSKYICVDTVGIATQTPHSITKYDITKYNPNDNTTLPQGNQIFPLNNDFNITVTKCVERNVTWEGVWDGISQYPKNTIPSPPSI